MLLNLWDTKSGNQTSTSTPSITSIMNVERSQPLGQSYLDANKMDIDEIQSPELAPALGSGVTSEPQNSEGPPGVGQTRKEATNKSPFGLILPYANILVQ